MTTRLKSFLTGMLFASAFVLPSSFSLTTFGATAEDNYALRIRPSICVSYDSEALCTMMLEISWVGGNGEPVCLNTTADDNYITCWSDQVSGAIEQPYEHSGNVVYQLVSMQNNRILADAEVQVISRDLRDTRRRHRHVWSIL